jgi:hypothetical protein
MRGDGVTRQPDDASGIDRAGRWYNVELRLITARDRGRLCVRASRVTLE